MKPRYKPRKDTYPQINNTQAWRRKTTILPVDDTPLRQSIMIMAVRRIEMNIA